MCTQHLQAFMDIVRSSKLSKPKTTKDHKSLPHKNLVNSALVLLTDHLAPTSEFSAEEEVNSSSTSRGDLDSDPAAGLLSPILIRQQATATEEEEGCICQQEGETKYKTKTRATAMRTWARWPKANAAISRSQGSKASNILIKGRTAPRCTTWTWKYTPYP